MNFGRITNVEQGDYGRDVGPASEDELGKFLAGWERQRGTALDNVVNEAVDLSGLPRTDRRRLRTFFEQDANGVWMLTGQETDEIECKRALRFDAKVLRAIASFANNRGGYIFFGVHDENLAPVGIPDEVVKTFDVARASISIRASMEPAPRFEFGTFDVAGKQLAALFVHHEAAGPVLASRTDQSFHEGVIYYRYPGESRAIRPPEFRKLLEERDRRARSEASRNIQKVLELGGKAAVIDVKDLDSPPIQNVVREGIEEADVLRNFVRGNEVQNPIMYVAKSCHTTRQWLPIFYFARQAGLTRNQIREVLEARDTNYVATKRNVLQRVKGTRTAFSMPSVRSREILDDLRMGIIPVPSSSASAVQIANAITGLEDADLSIDVLLPLLRSCIEIVRDDPDRRPVMWSSLYKAAARLDELYFDVDE